MDSVSQDELKSIYSDDYYEKYQSRYIEVSPKQREIWMRRLRVIEGMTDDRTGSERCLLDIGCGTGVFLTIAQSSGWNVSGIEISTQASALAAKAVGANRISQDIFALEETGSFDVITMWAIIEHLGDPLSYLEKAHSLLKPGGTLALATMSTDAWNRKLFGTKWRYFTPPEHLIFFNRENLLCALEKTGFHSMVVAVYFNELAFWHSISLSFLHGQSLPMRIARKALVAPVRVMSNLFQAGDIIEVFAKRV
ncbi:MAG: methyltransferase domain-containing protein [Anaerolineae bacterium]|nr:methyltransferase domain-containing protein [Anaerolineae bacterium]